MKACERVGQKYESFTVIAFYTVGVGKKTRTIYKCVCTCGAKFEVPDSNLMRVKSCGCVRQARSDLAVSYMPEYAVWEQLAQRCYNKNCGVYANYGGRGIRVCDEWQATPGKKTGLAFRAFLDHIGERPRDGRRWLIERIDNDGHYEPGNVRWALDPEQTRNKRTNRWVAYGGERWVIADLARACGVSAPQLHRRLSWGWTVQRAVETPTAMVGRKVWAAKPGNVKKGR
jgi:hypothetical protein